MHIVHCCFFGLFHADSCFMQGGGFILLDLGIRCCSQLMVVGRGIGVEAIITVDTNECKFMRDLQDCWGQ